MKRNGYPGWLSCDAAWRALENLLALIPQGDGDGLLDDAAVVRRYLKNSAKVLEAARAMLAFDTIDASDCERLTEMIDALVPPSAGQTSGGG